MTRRPLWAVGIVMSVWACTLPQTVEMTKLQKEAPVCTTVEAWESYLAALAKGPAGRPEMEALTQADQCTEMAAGTVVQEISIHEKLPDDSVAIRLERWEQPGSQKITAGVTWRSNLHSWEFKEQGGFWKFWK